MNPEGGLIADFMSPGDDYRLTFDDDGRVAYAYLKHFNKIVGDVWIYNRCETPAQPEWPDRAKLPFANPRAYTLPAGHVREPAALDDIEVRWAPEGGRVTAFIYIQGDLVASVGEGERPGRAKFAAKDGPLARRLAGAS